MCQNYKSLLSVDKVIAIITDCLLLGLPECGTRQVYCSAPASKSIQRNRHSNSDGYNNIIRSTEKQYAVKVKGNDHHRAKWVLYTALDWPKQKLHVKHRACA